MPTKKTTPASLGFGVDRKNDSWSFTAVPMSVSAHNRDREHRPGENPPLRDAKGHPDGDGGNRGSRPPGEPSDEQLLTEYRQGDQSSFPKLMGRYQRELYHFLVRFLGDRAAAEDVFQETFLQVHQSAGQFDTSRRFRPWLFTIAANKARDLIRSQARRPTNPLQASISSDEESGEFIDLMEAASSLPGEPLEREELQQQVQKTVMAMPDHLREILLLSYFHQFPYKQIGDILDIPLGTVKSRLHAAVAYFADRWRAANPGKLAS
jgi:RNA polymerase sigma-70 factor, ECF subfamily